MSNLQKIVSELGDDLVQSLREEYRSQGHVLTGRLLRSIEAEQNATSRGFRLIVYVVAYARYLERKIPGSRIPYSPGSGRKRSNYIDGLIDFWRKRGLNAKEAKSAAFATAMVHKREGMPTRKSFRFSRNGRRTMAIQHVVENEVGRLIDKAADKIQQDFEAQILSAI